MVDNGGPAFPVAPMENRNGDYSSGCDGMTLRDYFAAKAMAALMTSEPGHSSWWSMPEGRSLTEWVASDSYAYADAMIAERKK
jgi:hypothetical protein